MFGGRRKNKNKNNEESSSGRYNEDDVIEEIDMNDIKIDTIRSRISTPEGRKSTVFIDDRPPSATGSIGDVIDDTPKLQRGLKARHVSDTKV